MSSSVGSCIQESTLKRILLFFCAVIVLASGAFLYEQNMAQKIIIADVGLSRSGGGLRNEVAAAHARLLEQKKTCCSKCGVELSSDSQCCVRACLRVCIHPSIHEYPYLFVALLIVCTKRIRMHLPHNNPVS